jgi:hypothetical protein
VVNPDGVANAFVLSSNTSTAGVLVSINGTLQQPITSYDIVGNNQIIFTETPLTTDIIEIRYISVGAVTVGSLTFGSTTAVSLDIANVNVTGNILPSANVTYSLGSETLQWKDLWVSGNTVYIGGAAVTVANGQLSIGGNAVGAADPYGNVNVKAYTETMGFANYSNVNVAAYLASGIATNINISGNITANVAGFSVGYRDIPQIAAANVTLALTDAGKHFYDTSTAPITVTIPNNANVAFATGTVITFVNHSTGNLIIGRQDAVALYQGGNATSAGRTITSYGVATIMKVDTNIWFINGTGLV